MNKKLICTGLALCFLLSVLQLKGLAISQKEELAKVRAYIGVLDQKIALAKKENDKSKIVQLQELKQQQVARAAQLSNTAGSEAMGGAKNIILGLGFGGGCGVLSAGYFFPNNNLGLLLDGGIGIGNNYTVLSAGLSKVLPLQEKYYMGLDLTGASYSKTVTGINGLSGNIEQGLRLGVGIFLGGKIAPPLNVQLGYNTVLGLTVGLLHTL